MLYTFTPAGGDGADADAAIVPRTGQDELTLDDCDVAETAIVGNRETELDVEAITDEVDPGRLAVMLEAKLEGVEGKVVAEDDDNMINVLILSSELLECVVAIEGTELDWNKGAVDRLKLLDTVSSIVVLLD